MPGLFLLIVWVPVVDHYYVSKVVITDEAANRARYLPADSLLAEMNTFFQRKYIDNKQLVDSAEKVLKKEISIPGYTFKRLNIPFDADDIDKGPQSWQLSLAGFEIPSLLLKAYEVTGRDDFLMTARDIIQSWALYERKAWLPKGFLWNDHAVAARISVLAKFWKHYRKHPMYEDDTGKNVLQFVARSAKLLAEPSNFTYSTNHGIMQNLALMQICIAFPTLPDVKEYKQLAFHRMQDQMNFYINDEGVILEHSAGYQMTGIRFISMAFRFLSILDIPIPDGWKKKYEKAKDFYAQLRHPDGSLPMFGDTSGHEDSFGPFVTDIGIDGRRERLHYQADWVPKHSNSLFPAAGYSVWWDGLDNWPDEHGLSQTTILWSNYPGHAHKHADEMSVLLWADGQTWWTNAGYWPYGIKGREEAESWNGSNAPHLINEDTHSIRNTKLLSYGLSDHLNIADLERRGPREYIARRQVIHLKPNVWLVIDHTSGRGNDRTSTTWTTAANVKLHEGKISGSYILKGENPGSFLKKFIIASSDTRVQPYYGSYSPFAGWEMGEPASAIVVEQNAYNSWAAAIWLLEDASRHALRLTSDPHMKEWKGPDDWHITLPTGKGQYSIRREDKYISVVGENDTYIKKIKLIEAPDVSDEYMKIQKSYEQIARHYPQFKLFLSYRWRITYLAVMIFLVQEVFFFLYKKSKRKYYTQLRVISVLGWCGIVITWLLFIHFKA